ncbi:hypothetical protein HX837_07335 [Marine Group I thaumarchaeote]|uniref:Uncharacterized protein n=1 Tax=Marine Group I thaumarchaeote TaxID=2511932 RepID=A0A7K4MQY4_9ARCH|nr:hypothetical protein [Marine Group I thaumarchaeote]
MSGIVNSTGAVSGIIGTTVGTPAGAAGSIVQTSSVTTGVNTTNVGTTNLTFVVTVVSAAFTPTYNNSDVILHARFGRAVYNTTSDSGLALKWQRAISGGATTYPTSLSDHETGSTYSNIYIGSATGQFYNHISHTMLDSPATDSAITYTLYAAPMGSEGTYVGGGNNSRWWIFFQEVKR